MEECLFRGDGKRRRHLDFDVTARLWWQPSWLLLFLLPSRPPEMDGLELDAVSGWLRFAWLSVHNGHFHSSSGLAALGSPLNTTNRFIFLRTGVLSIFQHDKVFFTKKKASLLTAWVQQLPLGFVIFNATTRRHRHIGAATLTTQPGLGGRGTEDDNDW